MVGSISYDGNREICGLEIRNSANHVVFARRMLEPSQPGGTDPVREKASGTLGRDGRSPAEAARTQLTAKMKRDMQKELERTGVPLERVLERYQLEDIRQMTPEQYQDAMNGLKRTPSRAAA